MLQTLNYAINKRNNNIAGAFRSIGEKTSALFDRKKKDAEQIAAEKAQDASNVMEEQVKKTGEIFSGAQKSASDAAESGKLDLIVCDFLFDEEENIS